MNKGKIDALINQIMKASDLKVFIGTLLMYAIIAGPVGAQVLETKASLSLENTEIRKVLSQINKNTDVKFVYSPNTVPVNNKVSVNVKDKAVSEILDQILLPFKIDYKVINNRVLLYKATEVVMETLPTYFAESIEASSEKRSQRVISGKVTDEKGEAIAGVNILLKGTRLGTITDIDGNFQLVIPDNYKGEALVFSFIGYITKEVPLDQVDTINITLKEDATALEEVIVSGYQIIRKESFTGTALTVSGEELRKVNPVNLMQGVQAFDPSFRVAENNLFGSDPNRLPDITVRGSTGLPGGEGTGVDVNTLSRNNLNKAPNLPTFILNGFEVGLQTIYDLDMTRIESITLLKDAAATAVYGSRAANGVLVIVTKAPEEGKMRFTYNYDLTVTGPDLSVYNVLNAADKLEYERLAGLYGLMTSGGNQSQEELNNIYYQKKRNVLSGVDTYWLSDPVETALGHNHSLSIEGGTNVLLYSITARYQDMNGVMKGSGRNRFGGEVFLSYNLNNKLRFQNNLSVSEVKSQESPYGSFRQYLRMNPYHPKYDQNGNMLREVDTWVSQEYNQSTDQSSFVSNAVLNPSYDATLSSFDRTKYTQIINAFSVNWQILDGLDLRGLISLNKTVSSADKYESPLSNRYYNTPSYDLNKRGEFNHSNSDEISIDGNIVLAFHKNYGRSFINATLGGNLTDYTSDFKSFTAMGFTSDKFDNIAFSNRYLENASPHGQFAVERLVGSFSSLNYSYADKYLLDASIRIDGSSKFGNENKFAPFWATGIGWNLHNEDFFASSDVVNQFRIRASTGLTGEVSFPAYMARTTYQYYNNWYSSGVGARHMGYGNEALRWQRTQNYDLGMEVSLFKNRLFFSPRYYYKLTNDLLADIIVPPSMGFNSYKANLGKMENQGFELNLNASIIRSKSWFVNLHTNMVHNQNRILEISESLKKFNDEVDKRQEEEEFRGTPMLRFNEGQSLNTIYGVPSLGIDPETGKELYLNRDGSISYTYDVRNTMPIGDSSPTAEGFFGGTVGYKNLMLTVNFYTRFGGDMYNQTLVDRIENADPRFNVDQRVLNDRWRQPGDIALYKDIADQGNTFVTSRFIQRENILELKSVNLTYELQGAAVQRYKMQNARLMLTMNDIWRWSSIEQERGLDYPFARSFTFSLLTRF